VTADERAAPPSPALPRVKKQKKQLPIWQESILLLVVALGLAIVIKAFFVQAFYIPSESMEPGLEVNDRILVQKWSYWGSGDPERGDTVVFKDPGGWLSGAEAAGPQGTFKKALEKIGLYPSGGHLVKRVIGVPGDRITCCDAQGRIRVNGVPLNEPYLKNRSACNGPMHPGFSCGRGNWSVGPVPEGKLFVMGDHRDASADSSAHLCPADSQTKTPQQPHYCVPHAWVPIDNVVGKVFVLVWPSDRFQMITRPPTFEDLPEPS
jgi:signal peptidase I